VARESENDRGSRDERRKGKAMNTPPERGEMVMVWKLGLKKYAPAIRKVDAPERPKSVNQGPRRSWEKTEEGEVNAGNTSRKVDAASARRQK